MPLSDDEKAAMRAIVARVSAEDLDDEAQIAAVAAALREAGLRPTVEEWAAFMGEELAGQGTGHMAATRTMNAIDAIMAACASRGVSTLGELMLAMGVGTPGALLAALGFTGDTDALAAEVEQALRAAGGPGDAPLAAEEDQALHCRLVAEEGQPALHLAWLSAAGVSDANFEMSAGEAPWARVAGAPPAHLPAFMAEVLTPLMADMIARAADPSRDIPLAREEFAAIYEPYFSGLLEGAYSTAMQIRAGELPDVDDEDDEDDED